jgi:hypothetical protein
MLFSQDRNQLRQMYVDAWKKTQNKEPVTALEDQIASVIAIHPEYHEELDTEDLKTDYRPEDGKTNPFLHMGLHLAIREQIATNRPAGIQQTYAGLLARVGDEHDAQHRMIDVLAETLWEAQSKNQPPDEFAYLEKLRKL